MKEINLFQASIEGAESGLDLSFVSSLHVLGLQLGVVKVTVNFQTTGASRLEASISEGGNFLQILK